ncbi:P-selectin glycoprotein ligand 1 [Mixophyes fleayi]|uniref:P-selectin glycoprotein ligand 1 n=1 Tax=Mixophyes fleayi TaxID=3061075 RepID=UPI003F4E1448
MSSPTTTLLLFYTSFIPAISYKLPLMDESHLAVHTDKLLNKPNSSPLDINDQLELAIPDKLDETFPIFIRMKREIDDAKSTITSLSIPEMTSESPLEEASDTTPHILEANSSPLTEVQTMSLLGSDETTPLTDLDQTTSEETLKEAETIHLDKSVTELIKTSTIDFTLSPTKSEELSIFTSSKANKVTLVTQVQSTDNQPISSIQTSTNDQLSEDVSSSALPKLPNTTPSKSTVTLNGLTTGHGSTSGWIPVSSGSTPAMVTHTNPTSEDMIHTQSLMKQCMLTILILAVVCTVFIVTTIALAAKISALKQRHKHYRANYTEMRCISSLLPDSDQQSKAKPKRLKTFAANVEENDGDNTTLNSFLPE